MNKCRHLFVCRQQTITQYIAVIPSDEVGAAVSPDGKWVLVTRESDPGGWQLLRLPVSGGPPETILTLAGPGSVRCAAVGPRICLLSEAIGG